jgi:DNA (cytosine-5)-methyltransferase 1
MTKKIVSLFSGAGGLDFGFSLNGFRVILANDVLRHMAETYSENFEVNIVTHQPNISDLPVFFMGNITELKMDHFKDIKPDVLIGGPPCQDFSIVRGPEKERAGISVLRGRLYSYFVKALAHLRPKVFVFENVPGLVSSNRGEAYKIILEDFSNLNLRWGEIKELVNNNMGLVSQGYEIVYDGMVDASKLGVPQARKRLVVVGVRKGFLRFAQQKLSKLKQKVADILAGKNTLLSKYPLTPIEVFEGKPLPDLASKYIEVMKEYEGVAEEVGTPRALEWKKSVWEKLRFEVVDDYLALNRIKPEGAEEIKAAFKEHTKLLKELGYHGVRVSGLASPDGSNQAAQEVKQTHERMKRIPPDQNHEFVRGTRWEVEGRGMSLIYRRIHPLKPSYTVVAYGGGGTWGYHYERQRGKLTNRERARLQTFPDSFVFKGNSSQMRAQIGEAVPPFLGKRISEAVGIILGKT